MVYRFLTIVDASHDDDSLFPVLSPSSAVHPVELLPEDGRVTHLPASRVVVQQIIEGRGLRSVLPLPSDLKWDVLITDCRVIVYCTKYDKGGGWYGFGAGALVALAANAVSIARAAHRRKGKVLVGQVRYSWLMAVGGSPKDGWRSAENVRLQVQAAGLGQTHRNLYLTLVLPKHVASIGVAHQIATRCARYRLTNGEGLTDDHRAGFAAIEKGGRKAPVRQFGQPAWSWYSMPSSYRVSSGTARPSALADAVLTRSVDSETSGADDIAAYLLLLGSD